MAGVINENESTLGYYGSVVVNSDGTSSLALESGTSGDAGDADGESESDRRGHWGSANVVDQRRAVDALVALGRRRDRAGALTVNSSIVATSATPLSYPDSAGVDGDGSRSAASLDSGSPVPAMSLSGSISIQVRQRDGPDR